MNSDVAAPGTFREATAADVPILLRMMRCLAEQPPSLPFHDGEVRAALEEFFRHSEYGRVWLICVGGRVAGYAILTLGYSFEYRGRDGFVDELYVEPQFRRRGLGRQAMEFIERQARDMGVTALHLEVDRENDPALALYRESAYEDHQRYLMTKWLRRRP